jgi:hypothetical protein
MPWYNAAPRRQRQKMLKSVANPFFDAAERTRAVNMPDKRKHNAEKENETRLQCKLPTEQRKQMWNHG